VTIANWDPGDSHGVIVTSMKNMKSGTGLSAPTVRRALRELARGYPLGILSKNKGKAPALIEIQSLSGKTRRNRIRIRISKITKYRDATSPVNATLVELEKEINSKINALVETVAKNADMSSLFGK